MSSYTPFRPPIAPQSSHTAASYLPGKPHNAPILLKDESVAQHGVEQPSPSPPRLGPMMRHLAKIACRVDLRQRMMPSKIYLLLLSRFMTLTTTISSTIATNVVRTLRLLFRLEILQNIHHQFHTDMRLHTVHPSMTLDCFRNIHLHNLCAILEPVAWLLQNDQGL
ncbi:uncharacterized protein EI90DRAFT_245430 [Cantharellus anzutake]|uniref:uncharacterized protein n=1 Tax=Cantharellus anzutake TaxID=1750568 RepID=UPI001902D9BE|nr:uncharacterized protein EI90DRAFT_245430 [Cantharellus anzutake]KAF8335703.1 hypothetical protein EI90DRAFT_245430 [Cantharellus anzutake]